MKPKIGLIVFAEGRQREDVYQARKPAADRETAKLISALSGDALVVPARPLEVRAKEDLLAALESLESQGVDSILLSVPTFVQAALAAKGVRLATRPCMLLGNNAPDTYSQVGFFAAAGAIEQAGLPYRRITGDIAEKSVLAEILLYSRAVAADRAISGKTYGMIGGRSLGISTGTTDSALWLRLFGIDIEHLDQLTLVQEAEKIPDEDVKRHTEWIKRHYGEVRFQEGRFEEAHLDRMVRSYLAVRELIKGYSLDFVGIKCQPELSNGFVLQCLTVQLLNDRYDADGPKVSVPCSCEADCDGALTMELLKQLSDGKPTALQDIFSVGEDKLVLANCGSSASYFAALSDDQDKNLKEVYLIPHGFGAAGGAATQFPFAPGVYTYARLVRTPEGYRMLYFLGNVEKTEREDLKKYVWYRPTAVIRNSVNAKLFSRTFACNHLHCTSGDFTRELSEYCKLKGISSIRLDEGTK